MPYSPFTSVLYANIPILTGNPLTAGVDVITAGAMTACITPLSIDADSSTPNWLFNKNDVLTIRRYGVFGNFADGLLIDQESVAVFVKQSDVVPPSIAGTYFKNVLSLNSWYESQDTLPVTSFASNFNLWAAVIASFRTDIIDAAFNGSVVHLQFAVEIEHTFQMEPL
jgi:hypothetical protein